MVNYMRWNIAVFVVASLVVAGLCSGVTGETTPRTWSNMSPAQSPGVKICQGLAYDSESDRTIMFGGWLKDDSVLDDTWAYDCNAHKWTQMNPSVKPVARARNGLTYIPDLDLIFLTHGYLGGKNDTDDSWTYDYNTNTWKQVTLDSAAKPPARHCFNIAYNSKSRVILFYGGAGSTGSYTDTWTFNVPPPEKESQKIPVEYIIAMIIAIVAIVAVIASLKMRKKPAVVAEKQVPEEMPMEKGPKILGK